MNPEVVDVETAGHGNKQLSEVDKDVSIAHLIYIGQGVSRNLAEEKHG
jgi:hypothetical protein